MAKKIRMYSTEPQARKVLEGMKGKPKKRYTGQGKVTGTSPPGIKKSPARGKADLERLRQRQADRDLKDVDSRA